MSSPVNGLSSSVEGTPCGMCVRRGLTHDRVTACYSPGRQAQ